VELQPEAPADLLVGHSPAGPQVLEARSQVRHRLGVGQDLGRLEEALEDLLDARVDAAGVQVTSSLAGAGTV
jgi:hypothetical protein